MRPLLLPLAAVPLLVILTACGPGSTPPADPGDDSGSGDGGSTPPALVLADTDVRGVTAVATASNGAVLDIQLVIHAPEPFSADGAADAWKATTDWCAGEIDDQLVADQGFSFTTVDVTATTREGQWPVDTPLLLLPLPGPQSTLAVAGDAVVQANVATDADLSDGQVPHCAQPALLTKAGTGSIYLGIPGDVDGGGPAELPLGGWATHKYGVNAHQPGDAPAVDVTFSDCTVQITPLGTELGAPTASWQQAFQDDMCVVGGDTEGTDAG
ncbi:MAG: hypothetical protein ACTHKX_08650 [Pseudolysinimonas sp.]